MSGIQLSSANPWAPHPQTAPVTTQQANGYLTAANGTRTCAGGWQFHFEGLKPGGFYEISVAAACTDVDCPRDALLCTAQWANVSPDQARKGFAPWDYLLPEYLADGSVRFARRLQAPAGCTELTVVCTLRWVTTGSALWTTPQVAAVAGPAVKPPVRVAVVTGHAHARPRPVPDIATNARFYADLCERACEEAGPQLIALPEIALQWQVPGSFLELAVDAEGPEVEPFRNIAQRNRVRIVLGLYERDGDAVRNCALLIGPDGKTDGRYFKVHLAVGGEAESGLLPGDDFPVYATEIGRIGCNICMDTSAAESSRMVGLHGADFLVMPIMGDHRADRFSPGNPIFHESRWLAIMRTHAMDNQLCMVVARNNAQGSCVIDRKGDVLAWNEGDADYVFADVELNDGYRTWNGGCFRDVNWLQRRPHLYGAFVDPNNIGSLQ